MATRISLPNDQWIEVKDKLKVRDKRDIHTYSVAGVASDGLTYRFNVVMYHIATAAARILNWSLKDDRDKPIAYPVGKSFDERVAAIEGLYEDQGEAINLAIQEHDAAKASAAVTEKNETPDGVTA
jgi:hypothetical protein